jgi:hypothetical protein
MSSIMASKAPNRRGSPAGLAARPRRLFLTAGDVIVIVVINAVLLVAMWVRHGGLDQLGSASAKLTAAGQVTALA